MADDTLVSRNFLGRVDFVALQWTLGRYRRWGRDLNLLMDADGRNYETQSAQEFLSYVGHSLT